MPFLILQQCRSLVLSRLVLPCLIILGSKHGSPAYSAICHGLHVRTGLLLGHGRADGDINPPLGEQTRNRPSWRLLTLCCGGSISGALALTGGILTEPSTPSLPLDPIPQPLKPAQEASAAVQVGSGDSSGMVCLWDLQTGQRQPRNHDHHIVTYIMLIQI